MTDRESKSRIKYKKAKISDLSKRSKSMKPVKDKTIKTEEKPQQLQPVSSSKPERQRFILPSDPSIIVLAGKPKSGKSYAIRSIMYSCAKQGHFKFGICLTATKFNGDYDYLPDKHVWQGYDEARLEKYIDHLRQKTKEIKDKQGSKAQLPPNFVILDDLLGRIDMYSSFFANWVSTYRHTNTTIFITAQQLKRGISTTMRECTTFCFMFRTVFKDSVTALYESYGQLFEDFEDFKENFIKVTSVDHQALVFHNDQNNFDETYCTWIAESAPDFKLKY